MDLGAHPQLFGQSTIANTCFPATSNLGFRRDYFFVSFEILPYVSDFKVERDEVVPVHCFLSFNLRITGETLQKKHAGCTTFSIWHFHGDGQEQVAA